MGHLQSVVREEEREVSGHLLVNIVIYDDVMSRFQQQVRLLYIVLANLVRYFIWRDLYQAIVCTLNEGLLLVLNQAPVPLLKCVVILLTHIELSLGRISAHGLDVLLRASVQVQLRIRHAYLGVEED